MLLNHQWVNENIRKEKFKYLETNENGNTPYQNLWGAEKAFLKGKFIEINAYIEKEERSQNNFTLYLREI
jgi:hypothetical protein